MGLSQNKKRQGWMESNGMDRVERLKWETEEKRINWDWWRKEPKWGQNVVLGKELKLVWEKEDQGGKRNLDVRGKRVGYSDEVRNKLFHSLLCQNIQESLKFKNYVLTPQEFHSWKISRNTLSFPQSRDWLKDSRLRAVLS